MHPPAKQKQLIKNKPSNCSVLWKSDPLSTKKVSKLVKGEIKIRFVYGGTFIYKSCDVNKRKYI